MTKGIATLSEGELPPELFPISLLTNITTRVQHELTIAGLPYEVALKNPTLLYDLKLMTFGINQQHTLIITFPVLLKSTKAKPLTLFEIETDPVPIEDLETSAIASVRFKLTSHTLPPLTLITTVTPAGTKPVLKDPT